MSQTVKRDFDYYRITNLIFPIAFWVLVAEYILVNNLPAVFPGLSANASNIVREIVIGVFVFSNVCFYISALVVLINHAWRLSCDPRFRPKLLASLKIPLIFLLSFIIFYAFTWGCFEFIGLFCTFWSLPAAFLFLPFYFWPELALEYFDQIGDRPFMFFLVLLSAVLIWRIRWMYIESKNSA